MLKKYFETKCSHCKQTISRADNFCPYCGARRYPHFIVLIDVGISRLWAMMTNGQPYRRARLADKNND